MRTPLSTYRLQFHSGFGFREARELVGYLHALGITDLYASPLLVARSGSSHGYDATDAYRLDPDLGSEAEFRELVHELHEHGMGLLLDIVPNHMAASRENPWWMDVLENGPASPYAEFFDVDWRATGVAGLEGKVLLPVLGAPFGEVLEKGELKVDFDGEGFFVAYHDHRFPVSPGSYETILTTRHPERRQAKRPRRLVELRRLVLAFQAFARTQRTLGEGARLHRRRTLKRQLWRLYRGQPGVKSLIDEKLRLINGRAGEPATFDALERLLSAQPYRLAFWRSGIEEVNYRRFFDVNDLVAVRMEDPRVFERRHARLGELFRKGAVDGFRVDHVDGLLDPRQYLERLHRRLLATPRSSPRQDGERCYVVVEKILLGEESLPPDWDTAGTTGYELIQALSGLYLDPEGWSRLREIYARVTGVGEDFASVRRQAKHDVMETLLLADFRRLARELVRLAAGDRHARNVSRANLARALAEVSAALPVYRTYIRETTLSATDREALEHALVEARAHLPDRAGAAALAFLRRVLFLTPRRGQSVRQSWLRFVMRWQQFTGPLMAKGLEDTAFYRYAPLLSLNEVGGDPEQAVAFADLRFFHGWNARRQKQWPLALSATSTHDTKRGEDARARIHLLAERPDAWQERLEKWRAWNEAKKPTVGRRKVPEAREEVLLYQSLLGVWPHCGTEEPELLPRLKEFVVKAAREAKLHTSWIDPDEDYERGLIAFAERIVERGPDNPFRDDFLEFLESLAWPAAVHSLGQVVLKVAGPGVPDFYQGSELWTLSLVDPDNRRPVDFRQRRRLLADLLARAREAKGALALLEELVAQWRDGRLKMFVTARALRFRRSHPDLFRAGDYLPLLANGPGADHVCAFARLFRGRWAVALVPRRMARLGAEGAALPWRETRVRLPANAPGVFRNVLSGERVPTALRPGAGRELSLSTVWARLPVAFLSGLEPARPPHRS